MIRIADFSSSEKFKWAINLVLNAKGSDYQSSETQIWRILSSLKAEILLNNSAGSNKERLITDEHAIRHLLTETGFNCGVARISVLIIQWELKYRLQRVRLQRTPGWNELNSLETKEASEYSKHSGNW